MHVSATEASYNESMNLPDSELRLAGVAAAIGGLVVMMLAGQPSVASLGCGCLGLILFGVSRLLPRPAAKPVPKVAPEPMAVTPAVEATSGNKRGEATAVISGEVHAALQRAVRVQRPVSQMIVSSVLPPSRASRSPTTS